MLNMHLIPLPLVVAFINLTSWSKLVESEAVGKVDSVMRRAEGPRGCGICGTRVSGCSS